MHPLSIGDPILDSLHLAGERVPPGVYRDVFTGRSFRLETEGYLPASLDGRVACYHRIEHGWLSPAKQAGEAPPEADSAH